MSKDISEKVVDKAISKSIDGVSAFFGKICMPAADEIGLLLKDTAKYHRLKNLVSITEKTKKLLSNADLIHEVTLSPKFVRDVIEYSSWEEDDVIQDIWSGLIAGEIKDSNHSDDAIIYTSTLKSMSAYEARLLKLIYGDDRISTLTHVREGGVSEYMSTTPLIIPIVNVLAASPRPLNYIVQNRSHEDILANPKDHDLAFGFVKPQLHSLTRKGLIDDWIMDGNSIRIDPSSLGIDLYMRSTGIKIYPLDAYITVRKHWANEKKK